MSILGPLSLIALIGSQFFCDGADTGFWDFVEPDWEYLYQFPVRTDGSESSLTLKLKGKKIEKLNVNKL
jgi:hypothetical protein